MKKIIFVEKEDNAYDPVAAFFNKKAPSVPKSLNSTTKSTTTKLNNDKKAMPQIQKHQKPANIKKEEQITPKIGKKGQYQIPNIPKPYPLKQQVLKTRDLSKTNTKKQSKSNILKEQTPKIASQKSFKQVVEKQDSIQKMKEEQVGRPIKKDKVEASKLDSLSKRIKQLQQREQQYQRKIEQLQTKEQKYVKNQQKLIKIQKDFKEITQKSKQGQAAQQKLKQKQAEIKQMLEGNTIPFNRKRQVILNNKIKELKKLNKDLILRIKNYKGSDLVEMSIQQNREEITKDLYTVDVEKQLSSEMNAQMESLLVQLINKLHTYVDSRLKVKGQKGSWNNQQNFVLDIIALSEKISLNYLNNYDLTPIPKSNEEATSAYSILEEYKIRNQMKKVIDRFQLNFSLSKQNMDIINSIDATNQENLKIKTQIGKSKNKREDPAKLKEFLKIYEKKNNFLEILIIQNICQMQCMKSWLDKVTGKINSELISTSKLLGEIKDIVELGPSAKESLYLFLEANIQKLSTRYSNIKYELKNIHTDFKWIQSCSISK